MQILVVAATGLEIRSLLREFSRDDSQRPTPNAQGNSQRPAPNGQSSETFGRWDLRVGRYRDHRVDVLVTGVGMVATAAWCARALAQKPYDLALNLGVCGTFDRTIELGTVVHVVADRMPELGAEDDERFVTIQDMSLLGADQFPFTGGRLVNQTPPDNPALRRLRDVNGITVNTVHGNDRSIAEVARRFDPQVETMEGAAFIYACLVSQVPFAQVRAVSNVVEKRNRLAWKLDEAISNLGAAAIDILDHA